MTETPQQYKARILSQLQGREPLGLLAVASDKLTELIARTKPSALSQPPAPGKWTINEIVAHLADVELVNGFRMRMALSDPGCAIQAFDQDAWAVDGCYSQIAAQTSLALFRELRAANLALLKALTPEEWEHAGIHAERGRESVRDISGFLAGHDLNHFTQIEEILNHTN